MIVLILSYSSPSGKVKGQEERDLLFARLFGLYAVIRSGMLSNESLSQEDDFKRVVETVWLLGRSKTWLRESSGWIIVEAVKLMANSKVSWKDDSFTWLASKVCEAKEVGPESIAIYASLKRASPSLLSSTLVLPHMVSSDLLASANLSPLSRILKDGAGEDESAQNISSGSSRMQAHFVWDMLLQEYVGSDVKLNDKRAPLSETYRVLVDEALFANSASDQKKSWGFQIFEKALRTVAIDELPHLFTSNLMRTLMNQLSDKNRMLYKSAQRCVTTIQEIIKERPRLGFTIISQLVGKYGNARFDAITGTKTIESLLACMDADGVQRYVEYLIGNVCEGTRADTESSRKWALDQLLVVVRNASIPTNDDCVCNILSFLAAHGFFTMNAAKKTSSSPATYGISLFPKPALSINIKNTCRARFLSCLGEVADQSVTQTNAQGKVKRAQGEMTSGQSWISKAFEMMTEMEEDSTHFSTLYPTPKDGIISQAKLFSTRLSKAIQKTKDEEQKGKMEDLQSMLLAAVFYSRKDLVSNEAFETSLIEALIECSDRLVLGKKGGEGEPSAVELFVHCLVSFLEQPSAFLRSVATQAFASFSDEMNRDGLEQLLDQLGFNERDEAEEEGEVDVEGEEAQEEEEEEEDSDSVMSDSISETSATSDSSTVEGVVDPVLVAKLQEVLKAGGAADSDVESDEEDEDDSSEAESVATDFNDDQMMLIDDKLADIFRQRLGSRKEEEEQKKETIALHIKILDLLDVFARKQSNNPLCVDMVLPLFTIALEKDVALGQLKQRATTILQKTLCKSKDGLSGTLSAEVVFKAMEAVHRMAATKLPTPSLNLCSTVNLYLTKACKEEDLLSDKLKSLYLSTLDDFVQRKSNNLKPQFLTDVFQRLPLLGFSMRKELLAAASGPQESPKQSYRQLQALEMLRVALVNLGNMAKERDHLISFLPLVSNNILDTVKTEKLRLKEIVKVGLDLARLSKKVCKDEAEMEAIWSSKKINDAIEALEQSNKLPNSVSLQNLLRQLLVITTSQDGKNKSNNGNGKRKGQEGDKQAAKKKRKST